MNFQRGDMFYDNPHSHSSNPQRLQPQGTYLHQSPHFPVDSPANTFAGFYPPEDQNSRFDVPRFNDRMTAATLHGNYGGGYDMGGQTWNNNAFGGNTLGGLGGTNRLKSSNRGRSALPSVSTPSNTPSGLVSDT